LKGVGTLEKTVTCGEKTGDKNVAEEKKESKEPLEKIDPKLL